MKRRARDRFEIRLRRDMEGGGCSLIVVELQFRYRDKEERARLFIFARGCNLRRISMTGRR